MPLIPTDESTDSYADASNVRELLWQRSDCRSYGYFDTGISCQQFRVKSFSDGVKQQESILHLYKMIDVLERQGCLLQD